ncbi:ABC transporter ATP-binding protein [Pengzhenrongella sp.]|jgi:peptide/nickel transport system ATP-binding protein|uniref:ABC transporter ATP-binding protein n=1 Tax=Pengzhenrongella sp. TaxID=2888820 RepID=UPI002F95D767
MAMLEVKDLSVRYEPKTHRPLTAVDGVSFAIDDGEFVGLIGESGSGKTTLGMAILRLLGKPGRISGGSITFDGHDLTTMSQDELRTYRWRDIATVFQSSMNSLNPVVVVEGQFRDAIEEHSDLRGEAVSARVRELFDMVFIDHKFIRAYPHELSGGMKQRVNLALALANRPRFVLLDEPTTGLDVVVQRQILDNVRRLQREWGFAVLFISHDIGTVLDLSDRILVMYAGRVVEEQASQALLRDPRHPYAKGLLGSYSDPRAETVRITYVPGRPPDLSNKPAGCSFAPRCPERIAVCGALEPPLTTYDDGRVACHVAVLQRAGGPGADLLGPPTVGFAGPQFVKSSEESTRALRGEVLVEVNNVARRFERRRGFTKTSVDAVKDVSFVLRKGEVTALVGQSGSGKTTIARMITGVDTPTSGSITFRAAGQDRSSDQVVGAMRGKALRAYRSRVQIVFQDPYSSLNPTRTLEYILTRPLRNYAGMNQAQARERAAELLETVALTPPGRFLGRFAYELSGGERQRVVIARALAPEPDLIVADEPISSLDVSIRAEILQLLNKLVQEHDVGILYITHDLLSARMISDEIIVLNNGVVVEHGPALQVIRTPRDAYTRQLLEAVPNPYLIKDPPAVVAEPV